MMRNDRPYLSVVVATRNDDHGGDPLKRLQAFINTFDAQCHRTNLDAELVVVEWNPPADRPRLHTLIRIPTRSTFPIRFIEVPAELHARLPHADVLPLFQMIAKNVGIRRARGRFILSTNIDIIFSDALVDYLAAGHLTTGYRYRVNRHDIESDFPVDGSLEQQMTYCETHQLRLHTRSGTHHLDSYGQPRALDSDIVGSPGIFLRNGWHVREGDPGSGFFRWASAEVQLEIDRSVATHQGQTIRLEIEAGPNPYQPDSWVELEILEGERLLTKRRLAGRTRIRVVLGDHAVRQTIVMKMIDSSGGRDSLPLFERRETLCYRVYHMALTGSVTFPYDMTLWRRANDSTKLHVDYTPEGIDVTTAPEKYSYCLRYAPFESPVDARYNFEVEYSRTSGTFGLTVMDDAQQRWLPSTVTQIDEGDISACVLSVEVPRQASFSIYVSNHRPDGDGVSHFRLRRLAGSVPPDRLLRPSNRTERTKSLPLARMRESLISALHRRVRSAATSWALGRSRQRFERRIVADSERVQDLEAQIKLLMPYAELAPVERLLREHRPPELHQNASGDFQLLAREHWFELRGFAEFPMYSMNIDGLFETVAHFGGIKEKVLETPLCAYHLEHEKGSGWTPEGEALLKQRIAASGIRWLDSSAVHVWSSYMHWLQHPMIFNGSNWGFGDVTLPETTVRATAEHA
jgi:hypothetical protein